MARSRIVVSLLLDENGGLVKTVKFNKRTYIGDPINAVRIFNEKGVDEIVLLDIDASRKGYAPNFQLIEDIVSEAFVPVAYGGGISNLEQMSQLFYNGVEKVVLSSAAYQESGLVTEASSTFGSQSISVCLEYKKNFFGRTRVTFGSGRRKTGYAVLDAARKFVSEGVGELLVYSIDRDGTYQGYDIHLLKQVCDSVDVPVVGCGGAIDYDDIGMAFVHTGCAALAAGSVFVYKHQGQGILLQYPDEQLHNKMLEIE